MEVFSGGKKCKNSLRLLSTENMSKQEKNQEENLHYFCVYSQNQTTNGKKYSLLPYDFKSNKFNPVDLTLDKPSKVIVINNKYLLAIEKKCITLYRIHEEHIITKDFNSVGIENHFIVVELQHLKYKNKDYVLIFGNEKEDVKPNFKCLVYELQDSKLKFIKKATLFEK